MGSLAGFYDGLKAALENDVELAAWATSHFGKALTFFDGVAAGPVEIEPDSPDLPCVVIEPDDAEAQVATLGPRRFRIQAPMLVSFAWRGATPAAIHQQRLELPEIVLAAIASDHTLGGSVLRAWLDPTASWAWEPTERPVVLFGVRVLGEYDRSIS